MINVVHVLLTIILLITMAICGHWILNTLSYIYFVVYQRFNCGSAKQDRPNWVEILPRGFSLYIIAALTIYVVGYILDWKLGQIVLFNQIFIIVGVISRLAVTFASSEKWGWSAEDHKSLRQQTLYYAPIVLLVAFSSYMLGNYPFFLSDDFGHLTIINRLLEVDMLKNPLLYMPDDVDYITFFPWHGLLAGIGSMLNASALEIFAGAKVFLSATAVLSFISFCLTIFSDEEKMHRYVISCAIVYSFLAPLAIFHGIGEYRGVTQILLFQAARILWVIAFFRDQDRRHDVAFVFLLLSVSLIHIIDNMAFVLMYFPYAIYVNIRLKDAKTVVRLGLLGVTVVIMSWFIKTLFYSVAMMPFTYSVETVPYLKSYFSQLDTSYGIPLIIITVLTTVFIVRLKGRSSIVRWWPIGALASTLLLGSANPLLTSLYARLVSAELMTRTMGAFPIAILLGLCFSYLIGQLSVSSRDRQFPYAVLILLITIGALGRQLWWRFGMDGVPSPNWPGSSYSLLVKQPNLFRYIISLDQKVILTDLMTSAPITAISSNYTYTNRPYIEIDQSRVGKSLTMMQGIGKIDLVAWFCKEGIDILILNPKAPFHPEQHVDRVFKDYYKYVDNEGSNVLVSRNPAGKYIKLLEIIDGASIYSFDRKEACNAIAAPE